MRHCTRILFVLLAASAALPGQTTVAPTPSTVGTPRGEDSGGYNILNSFELGYRFASINDNRDLYRSQVNFRNGFRLLSSSLSIFSKEGQGGLFDELILSTSGLGNDPYQFATFRLAKNKLYRYDLTWRENDYFNPAASISFGTHRMDTTRLIQDHNFTLFPQSNFRLLAGYTRNQQQGPAFSTVQQFDLRGQEFPLFENVRRSDDEYRAGFEAQAFGIKLIAVHAWEFFKDDTTDTLSAGAASIAPANGSNATLNTFRRADPIHGSTPSWRIALFRDQGSHFSMNGRFTYAGGRRNFVYDEFAGGLRTGADRTRQVFASGNARRPSLATNLNLNFFPTRNITITNQTSYNDTRIDGDAFYRELNNGASFGDLIHFQFLGIRTVSNSTDVNVRITRWAGVYAGYRYSTRNIRSTTQLTSFGQPDRLDAEQDNTLNAGVVGFRLKPVKPVTLTGEAEIGRADHPIYTISERNYHALAGRAQYKRGTFLLTGLAKTNYNFNSTSLTAYSSRSRTYGVDASWSRGVFGFDAGYQKLHLDTLGGIQYFAAGSLVTGDNSLYISNLHSVQASARISIRGRVDLSAGLSRIQDTGDGRRTPASGLASGNTAFQTAQTFPLAFTSPLARVSVKLQNKLRWNIGYQYYSYGQDFPFAWGPPCSSTTACALPAWIDARNYKAHTGYTSLLWSF